MIVDDIAGIRRNNNELWMDLLRIALKANPVEAKKTLRRIVENDRKVTSALERLVQ